MSYTWPPSYVTAEVGLGPLQHQRTLHLICCDNSRPKHWGWWLGFVSCTWGVFRTRTKPLSWYFSKILPVCWENSISLVNFQPELLIKMNSSRLIFQDKNFRWLHHRFAREKLLTMLCNFLSIFYRVSVVEFVFY